MKNDIKYLKYLFKHKWYVAKECFKRGLYWQGIIHDLSKFLPSEYFAYRDYFYNNPENDENYKSLNKVLNRSFTEELSLLIYKAKIKRIKDNFDYAWCYHQKRNKHHFQYFLLKNDDGTLRPLEMPIKYRKETLSDWAGCSYALKGFDNTLNWYTENRKKMIIAPETREWLEKEIGFKL